MAYMKGRSDGIHEGLERHKDRVGRSVNTMIQHHSPMRKSRNYRFRLIRSFWVALLAIAILGFNAVRGQVPEFAGTGSQPQTQGKEIAVLAGGCFWGVDAVFKHVKGVKEVVSGYSGGKSNTAEYEVVSTGTTGHAE